MINIKRNDVLILDDNKTVKMINNLYGNFDGKLVKVDEVFKRTKKIMRKGIVVYTKQVNDNGNISFDGLSRKEIDQSLENDFRRKNKLLKEMKGI